MFLWILGHFSFMSFSGLESIVGENELEAKFEAYGTDSPPDAAQMHRERARSQGAQLRWEFTPENLGGNKLYSRPGPSGQARG